MRRKKLSAPVFHAIFVTACLVADVLFSLFAMEAAYFLRLDVMAPQLYRPSKENYYLLALIFTILLVYFNNQHGLYKPQRGQSAIDIVFNVVKSVFFSSLALLALLFFYRDFSYARLIMIVAMVLAAVLISAARIMIYSIERSMLRGGHGQKRLLLIGTGGAFASIVERLAHRPELGYRAVGYLEEEHGKELARIPLAGNIDEIEEIIVLKDIDVLIVTLESGYHYLMREIVDICDRRGLECLLAPDMMELLVGPRLYEEVCGVPLIRMHGIRIRGLNAFMKRTLDLSVSGFTLFVLSPLFAVIALLVKLESPGPVFYTQKRVGLDGGIIWMTKFRSMRIDAETNTGPGWSTNSDSRVTRLGGLLRKFSLDELPQFFNVLRGDMSLVGPRPERPYFVEKFDRNIPRYMERHKVKAGMTGWAQVNGLRGDTSIEDRVRYDLYYIENWSVWFDLKIMILTVFDILSELKR